ncbi:DUF7472 family protein [Halocalculus aciditolerans]|uniref:Uncharacterized protein n=1 Tax=Halocalculus aciditolerans TaxID=1383812 RepID=A0A830F7A1_9EURY|nr:hypothetical protein [Halocalculus aciditolerans]GGL46329.1 hypothetical protein GCM10009039_00910 [Halocalculus aciditolerans]
MVERETVVEAAVALIGVVLFYVIVIGGASVSGSSLGESGALTVLAGIVVFVVSMAGAGWWLSTQYD